MSSSSPTAGPSSAPPEPLERFWHPPPASLSSLPALRSSLSSFISPSLRISRVAQLDATLLDDELESILHAPVKTALEGVRTPGKRSWEPEVLAVLRLAIMRMSLYETGATYGSTLQNLRYRNEGKHEGGLQTTALDSSLSRFQKFAYTALVVLPPYLHSRLQDRMLTSSWADEPLPRSWFSLVDLRRLIRTRGRRREEEVIQWKREWKRAGWEILGVTEKLAGLAGVLNFLIFLHNGRYRTLIDRVLKMRLVYAQRTFVPNVSFEYLNRQLVWEAFTEFLLFLLPLINLHRFRLRLTKALSRSTALKSVGAILPSPIAKSLGLATPSKPLSSSPTASLDTPQGPYAHLPPTTCPICYALHNTPSSSLPTASFADPTLPSASIMNTTSTSTSSGPTAAADTTVKIPYVTDCRFACRYCYYCVVGALARADEEAEDHWECLRCGGEVRSVRREVVGEEETEVVEEEEEEAAEGEKQEDEAESESSNGYEVVDAP